MSWNVSIYSIPYPIKFWNTYIQNDVDCINLPKQYGTYTRSQGFHIKHRCKMPLAKKLFCSSGMFFFVATLIWLLLYSGATKSELLYLYAWLSDLSVFPTTFHHLLPHSHQLWPIWHHQNYCHFFLFITSTSQSTAKHLPFRILITVIIVVRLKREGRMIWPIGKQKLMKKVLQYHLNSFLVLVMRKNGKRFRTL